MRSLIPPILASGCLVALAGCAAQPVPETPPSAPPVIPAIPAARTGADAYRELAAYARLGLHRTGTEGGDRLIRWLSDTLAEDGLQPQVEPFAFHQYLPIRAALTLADGSDVPVFPYWYSGRTPPAGVTAELVDLGGGGAADFAARPVSGKLVLVDIPLKLRALMASLPEVERRAHAAGAIGLVAVIQGAPEDLIVAGNAESEAGLCGLPILFTSARSGKQLRRHPGASATFTLDADYREGNSANVIATIPGRSPDTVILGTPVNGWFTTASERGAGIGTLLTLARSYAERARSGQVPAKTLVFVFSGGHEVGYLGLQHYIDAHPEVLARTYAYVHLGASIAGTLYFTQPDGKPASAPLADPARMLFVSENPLLQRLVSARQLSSGFMPAQTMLPSVFDPGEQSRMYARGIPIISTSGTTLYFHTEADTAETTTPDLLDPAVRFYGAVVDDLIDLDPALVLKNNGVAASYAKPAAPPVCVVPEN